MKDGFECFLEAGEEVGVQELLEKDENLMNLTKPASQTTHVSEPIEIPCISGTSQNEDQDPINNSSDPNWYIQLHNMALVIQLKFYVFFN